MVVRAPPLEPARLTRGNTLPQPGGGDVRPTMVRHTPRRTYSTTPYQTATVQPTDSTTRANRSMGMIAPSRRTAPGSIRITLSRRISEARPCGSQSPEPTLM